MWPEARERISRSGPLLIGALLACNFAAAGLTSTLNDPPFEVFLHLMIFAAVGASALATMLGRSSSWLGVVVMAAAVAAVPASVSGGPLSAMVSTEAMADQDLIVATLLAWMMVGFCFMLSTRRNVLFCLVTGLAIFGLTATVNLNTGMMVYFGLMIFAGVFVWGYEHLLNLAEGDAAEGDGRPVVGRAQNWWRLARTQALAGTLLVAGVMVAGIAIGTALYAVGPRLYMNPGGAYRYAQWIQISLLSYGGMLPSFYVGRGPVTLPATPAIEVKAASGQLWRGQTYDQYTGRGWSKSNTGTSEMVPDGDWLRVPGAEDLVGERLVQKVKLVGMESRAMYAAARPVAVRMSQQLVHGHNMQFHAQIDAYECPMTKSMMPRGVEFEVVSVVPPSDPEVLRARPSEYSEEIARVYVNQVTPGALADLERLVEELTADARTPYDKVATLREYIEKECAYSYRAPAVPAGEDAAAYFVTRSKVGACDLFATSLAVMCRIAGVPARVVTGFITGTYDSEREAFVPLQRDAHAWAEVYFPGIGWVPFDAAAERVVGGGEVPVPLTFAQLQRRINQALDKIWSATVVALGVIALVSALLGPGVLWRWLRRRFARRGRRARLGEVYEWFGRRAAKMAGIRHERWRTPAELRDALAGSGMVIARGALRELDEFTDNFYARRYGPSEPTDGQVRRLAARARRLLSMMRQGRRGKPGEVPT